MQTTSTFGLSVNALCREIKRDNENRVTTCSSRTSAIVASLSSLVGFFLLDIALFSEKRISIIETAHINSSSDHYLDGVIRITTYVVIALCVGKITHTLSDAAQKARACALKTFRTQIPKDKDPFSLASRSLLKSGMTCLSDKGRKIVIQRMNFSQLLAVADSVGRQQMRSILSGTTSRWDAILMCKILELPTSGKETYDKLSDRACSVYLKANVFFYRGLQEHLKDHEQPEVHLLLRQLQWGDISSSRNNTPSTLMVRFADGTEAPFPKLNTAS